MISLDKDTAHPFLMLVAAASTFIAAFFISLLFTSFWNSLFTAFFIGLLAFFFPTIAAIAFLFFSLLFMAGGTLVTLLLVRTTIPTYWKRKDELLIHQIAPKLRSLLDAHHIPGHHHFTLTVLRSDMFPHKGPYLFLRDATGKPIELSNLLSSVQNTDKLLRKCKPYSRNYPGILPSVEYILPEESAHAILNRLSQTDQAN